MKKRRLLSGTDGAVSGIRTAIRQRTDKLYAAEGANIRRAAECAAYFAGALVLGATDVRMGVYPFGTALICSASGALPASCAFAGAVLSTLAMRSGGLWYILIYCALFSARAICGIVSGALKEAGAARLRRLFSEPLHIRITFAAGACAVAGIISIFNSVSIYYSVFSALLGLVLYVIFTAAFYTSVNISASAKSRMIGICGILFAITATMDSFALPFSLGVIFAFFIAVYATFAGGIPVGVLAGFFCAAALEAQYVPMYPIAALICGLLFEYSAGGAVIAATVCSVGWAALSGGFSALTDAAPEIILTCAVTAPLLTFGVLPKQLPRFLSDRSEADPGLSLRADCAGERYEKISRSLEALSKMLRGVSDKLRCPSSEEALRICSAVRARYCAGCRHECQCRGDEESEVASFFDNMAHRVSTHGKAGAAIVPERLARRCYNMDSILDAVNTSAKRCAGLSSASEKTELFAEDYAAIAGLLRESSADDEWTADGEAASRLRHTLMSDGFTFADASVYGKRRKHVFMRGVDAASSTAGENDIRTSAGAVLGCRLSPPEFSIDGSYISASMHTVAKLDVKSGRYSSAGVRDDTSGDSVCSFRNDEGYYYTLVSDGMGSGRDAAICSGISSMFLKKLLSAGCPMKSTLEMLNCFVRGGDGECFTTVDLMEIDLLCGRARFIKSGAAPSFVLRGGQLFRLHSKTVPVGIMRALDAESISFELMEGDTVIMMSDGVTGSYEDCPWLYELLCSGLMKIDSPSAAARLIGEAALKNTGADDDITVCVMQIRSASSMTA